MHLLHRFTVTALSALAIGLTIAPSAEGAETIGRAFPYLQGVSCPAGTYIQTASASNRYAAPFDGVITSWSHENLAGGVKFKVARLGAGGSFTVIAEDGPYQYRGGRETNLVRIPVRQGDVIGYHTTDTPCPGSSSTGSQPGDVYQRTAADVPAGGQGFFEASSSSDLPIEATLERDRDADGFGDETQDECPTNAVTQGACPLPTTLGQTIVPYSGAQSCGTSTRVVTDSPGVISAAAHDGVVTSWSYLASSIVDDGTIRVKMLRPLGASAYRVIGADEPRTPTPNVLNTFPVRIPVREGDRIGLGINGSVPCSQFTAPGGYQQFSQDLPVGAEGLFFDSDGALDVSAVLEADADSDGFGDTSQDQCPSDATTQDACAVDPGPNTACEKARKKLATAKAKLKKLKQKEAAAKKVKAVKQKVKKAKAKVKKAC